MCGLTGLVDWLRATSADRLHERAARMAATLSHRGPDASGVWADAAHGVALGHARLSILDLSPAGAQPMASPSGRYHLVYNGEVYNHQELREQLPATIAYRGHSDTETLLAGFETWGIVETMRRSIGMFAIAVWDAQRRELTLLRDRLGIKPLYYALMGDVLLFGSELKALRADPSFTRTIDRGSLGLLLRFNYIPTPATIYEGVCKLPAGCAITFSAETRKSAEPIAYWSLRDVADRGLASPFRGSYEEAVDALESLLGDAVRRRLLSDVPLGAFLSGGIDSSLVTALMRRASAGPVKTFCIGFEEAAYDEAPFAREVARHLETDHTEHYATASEAWSVIPKLPTLFDEPFADSSQIPTYLVCELARRHVTVSLSGDGGDELFCGYRRYFDAFRIGRATRFLPRPMRPLAAAGARFAGSLMPHSRLGEKLRRGAHLLLESSPEEVYRRHMQHWRPPLPLVGGAPLASCEFLDGSIWPAGTPDQLRWMFLDTRTYLPDDILVKVDRTSMGVGLEARVPLIDHRVVEFAWSLPLAYKTDGHTGKRILRSVLERHVPRNLFERPKTGFGIPLHEWLRGPLRDWGESLLAPDRLQREGFFDTAMVRRCWDDHQSGRRDGHYLLWDVLMFQAWLDAQAGTTRS